MVSGTLKQKWFLAPSQSFLKSKRLNRVVTSNLSIPSIVFVTFFLLSLGIGGPSYLSDEIGYLSKASTVAGSTVHLATSWFVGYSLLISPAFLLSSNPNVEWNIILIINALMWAGSAALLKYVLTRTHPRASSRAIFFATLGAMLYPSWMSMSGYAFATSGFVLFFMASLAAILKSNLTSIKWLVTAAVCVGYLSWIHPMGLLFLGVFAAVLLLKAIVDRNYKLALIPIIALVLAITYFAVVQPWFVQAMSGTGANDSHYSAGVAGILPAIFTASYWLQAGTILIGLLFSTAIATFGLTIYGAVNIAKRFTRKELSWKKTLEKPETIVAAMSVLIVVGVMLFTALTWGASKPLRVDQWIYGRYTEMFILPLIAFGLLSGWRFKLALKIACLVIVAGILLSVLTNQQNTAYAYINKVNLQSFWPVHLPLALRTNSYWVWGLFGAIGIAICGLTGTSTRKKYLPVLVLPVLVLAGAGNYMYQYRIAHGYSAPSSLYQYVQSNYAVSDCIGYTTDQDTNERFNLYSYYLHGYNFQKMTLKQWQQQDCKGPYLTYDSTIAASKGLQISGVETRSGLYMVTRSNKAFASQPNDNKTPIFFEKQLLGYATVFN